MSKNQTDEGLDATAVADVMRESALRRGDVVRGVMPRPYLITTPRQHYEDQAKLALFDELVAAARDVHASCRKWAPQLDRSRLTTVLAKVPA